MEIIINGKRKNTEAGTTLIDLLEEMGLNPQSVVIEHNGSIVNRASYAKASPADNDTIEILQFVGGG